MALYEDVTAQQKQDEEDQKSAVVNNAENSKHKISIKKELVAMNGKSYPSEKVFVEALKYLKTEVTIHFLHVPSIQIPHPHNNTKGTKIFSEIESRQTKRL